MKLSQTPTFDEVQTALFKAQENSVKRMEETLSSMHRTNGTTSVAYALQLAALQRAKARLETLRPK